MIDIKVPENSKMIIQFFSWALAKTGKDSVHLLDLGSLLNEWEKIKQNEL